MVERSAGYGRRPGIPTSLLVSACLLGVRCNHLGEANTHDAVVALRATHRLVPVCPETAGGLPTPRRRAERQPDGTVRDAGRQRRHRVVRAWRGARGATRGRDGRAARGAEGAVTVVRVPRDLRRLVQRDPCQRARASPLRRCGGLASRSSPRTTSVAPSGAPRLRQRRAAITPRGRARRLAGGSGAGSAGTPSVRAAPIGTTPCAVPVTHSRPSTGP